MRRAEMVKGIQVYEDKELKIPSKISKEGAKIAVIETAFSRSAMNVFTTFLPYFLISGLGFLGVSPRSFHGKTVLTVICTAFSLWIGLPFSVALFPPISKL